MKLITDINNNSQYIKQNNDVNCIVLGIELLTIIKTIHKKMKTDMYIIV